MQVTQPSGFFPLEKKTLQNVTPGCQWEVCVALYVYVYVLPYMCCPIQQPVAVYEVLLQKITLCGDLRQTLIASLLSTFFCPKIFCCLIRNAFWNCVSNWKCWKVWLAAKKTVLKIAQLTARIWSQTTCFQRANVYSANHQIVMWMLVKQMQKLCHKSWFHRVNQHRKPTLNVMWMAWGQKKALHCGEKLKSVEIRTRLCFLSLRSPL